MLEKPFILAYVGNHVYERGMELYKNNLIGDLRIQEDTDNSLVQIQANADSHEVEVQLDQTGSWIFDCSCDCNFFRKNLTNCRHIAGTLIKYAETNKTEEQPVITPAKETNSSMKKLLDVYKSDLQFGILPPVSPIIIEPYLSSDKDHQIKVSFKIGMHGQPFYVIQNISEFCDTIRKKEYKKYGKQLEFVHQKEYFKKETLPLLSFLLSITLHEDSFHEDNMPYYPYYTTSELPPIRRNLFLKGRYLDAFMDAIKEVPFYIQTSYSDEKGTLSKEPLEIQTSLTKQEDGYLLEGNPYPFFLGNQYIYFLHKETNTIHCTLRKNDDFEKLLDLMHEESIFISNHDLPAFSKYIYPTLSSSTRILTDSFDPFEYIIPKPLFEIYLDMPERDYVTCRIMATYPFGRINILENTDKVNQRNEEEEQEFIRFLSVSFSGLDNEKHVLVLDHDEARLYQLLKEGIPSFQQKASVFITDALKGLTATSAPKIRIGLSYHHDLLQLDLIGSDIDRRQIAEILSRYDHRKKYYRLKDGSFIDVDTYLTQLSELTDGLSIAAEDIENGSIELPKYRAWYLEELANEDRYVFDRDDSFETLIWQMKDSGQKKYTVPAQLQMPLRPYQKKGFTWLCTLKDNGFCGLLADEMGLGKTIQVISFLGAWKDRKRTLIVCPASLVYNWYNEIHRFLPDLHPRILSGNADMRKVQIMESAEDDILITSYDLLKRDIEIFKDMHFSCQVIDEAQYIKNHDTLASKAVKQIRSDFRIALTGTPIENRLSELWSIFDYLMPGFLYGYHRFRDDIEIPIIRDHDEESEKVLQRLISPFVLRRMKKDVLKDLPDKLEEVYYASLEDEQQELYEARVKGLKLSLLNQSDAEFRENRIAILAELTRLRQICCDPSLIYENYAGNSAKTDLCIDMIRTAADAGHKVLLFSQFTSMLDILTKRLRKEGILFHLLTGDTPSSKRIELADSFQVDETPVFCISLKAGGTGLNLTAADVVIHYDPWWNTAVENQASDRAHRIGQKNIVTVYRLITKDTIEEKILEMQKEKADLADRIFSGESISDTKLTREELLKLL